MAETEKKDNPGWANIVPPQKGEVRNPKGRGKGVKNRATYYNEILQAKMMAKNPISGKEVKMPVEKIIALKVVGRAINGDLNAAKMIQETMYGKLPIDVNLGGQVDNPVVERKIAERSVAELLMLKYGPDSDEVKSYNSKYGGGETTPQSE